MKTPPATSPAPRRILSLAIGGATLVIVIGSLIALNQSGVSPAVFASMINEAVSRLAGANLIVQADRTVLPADGQTTTAIHAETANSNLTVTATIISGSGAIATAATTPGSAVFTYTTGITVGQVVIEVTAGSLTQTVELELREAVIPATPILIAPSDDSTTNNPKPEVAGTGPLNTKILITDNGNTNTIGTTDDQGNFRFTLDQPLYAGRHTLAAIAKTELGVLSQVSNLVTLTVQAEPLRIDIAHIRTSPTRPVAGDSFGLFVPASLNTAKVTVELQGQTFELYDLHSTSVFSGTLPSPQQPGVITVNLIAYDAAGNATRFDNTISIVVSSR